MNEMIILFIINFRLWIDTLTDLKSMYIKTHIIEIINNKYFLIDYLYINAKGKFIVNILIYILF